MPVKAAKNRRSAVLTCDYDGCAATVTAPSTSPAAAELTACESANKTHGWAFDVGWRAMMFGHTVYCPDHK